jgi:hypothetical protein
MGESITALTPSATANVPNRGSVRTTSAPARVTAMQRAMSNASSNSNHVPHHQQVSLLVDCTYGGAVPEEVCPREHDALASELPADLKMPIPELNADDDEDDTEIEVPDYRTQDHVINLVQLRKLSSLGIPDEGSHRGVVWRVLLGYLPLELSQWEGLLQEKRQLYHSYCADYFVQTHDVRTGDALRCRKRQRRRGRVVSVPSYARTIVPPSPDPPEAVFLPDSLLVQWKQQGKDLHVLESLTKGWNALKVSEPNLKSNDLDKPDWKDFIESATLLDEIHKDVVRTHPDLSFFLDPDQNLGDRRYAALERILFVWAKYNQGVRYVQGMNELVSAMYYVLANDTNEIWSAAAEADTYWIMNTLFMEMQDVFVADLDDADTGIQGRMANLHALLTRHDPEVQEHLQELGIDASFYAIRWWTTLLSREFLLPDTIRLWDSMFASTRKDNFLRYVCVTMVMLIRDDLLKGDFSACLRLLQSYPPCHMDNLLESSKSLWIYESQITLACHKAGIGLHQALNTIYPPPGIIMGFGLRNGVAPKSRTEQLEEAGEKAAAKVEEITTAMAASAHGWLGRANRLYRKYSDRYANNSSQRRSQSVDDGADSDSSRPVSKSDSSDALVSCKLSDEPTLPPQSEDEDVYLSAILNA